VLTCACRRRVGLKGFGISRPCGLNHGLLGTCRRGMPCAFRRRSTGHAKRRRRGPSLGTAGTRARQSSKISWWPSISGGIFPCQWRRGTPCGLTYSARNPASFNPRKANMFKVISLLGAPLISSSAPVRSGFSRRRPATSSAYPQLPSALPPALSPGSSIASPVQKWCPQNHCDGMQRGLPRRLRIDWRRRLARSARYLRSR
jgi:hypothetical protein